MELECHIALAGGNSQLELRDLGLGAHFLWLELRCGTEVRNEFGSSVLVKEWWDKAFEKLPSSGVCNFNFKGAPETNDSKCACMCL